MATLVLAATGSALGGALGGSIAGLTSLALGKAAGATLGSLVDQRLLGLGAEPVETGKVDRFRIMGSSEGSVLPRVFGRARIAGQIIWSSRFLEGVHTSNVGGKGGGQQIREFSYSISLAIALCEGTITRVGRMWADGQVLDQAGLNWRLHDGSEVQLPDPLISAVEGEGLAPAYRGTAYIVFENLDLSPFGNRIPQFNFEVFRRPVPKHASLPESPASSIRGVALVPGTGEYALATERVVFQRGKGDNEVVNVHNDQGLPDFLASTAQMTAELPGLRSVSLVVSWFGDDLRCGDCTLRPAVEQRIEDGEKMPWQVSGIRRADAKMVSRSNGRPVFGGTPTDESVVQAIGHLREIGQSVMFYPFILMDIVDGNGLADPWSDATSQPTVPWRGRMTLSNAPGRIGTSDGTAAAALEVETFFGKASVSNFRQAESGIEYDGPVEWSYRRFILHYAHLCAAAGGVDAFCIGSEMRSLTQIRDGRRSYPAVRALRRLASDVRSILGANTKIGYAADWSEYFGHQPQDGSGDVIYNLDPLWSDPTIDFVGIDNYMPLSDWRDGSNHKDVDYGSIYNLEYLVSNVAGGEGYDWYYASVEDRNSQIRTPIKDGLYGEHWVFRYKDIKNWWSHSHYDRIDGVKVKSSTSWAPRSKPIWFTEFGCPAADKGANQPNVFYDPKSSESFFPYYSSGGRDDFIQTRYIQANIKYWRSSDNNPYSTVYAGKMVDMERAHVWAWDARPWPDFPVRIENWSDGGNYDRGHWLNGRVAAPSLAEVVADIAERSGVDAFDVKELYGELTGYTVEAVESGRQTLQPLMLGYGFESHASEHQLVFGNRDGRVLARRTVDQCVAAETGPVIARTRAPLAETAGRVTLGYVRGDADYQAGVSEARGLNQTQASVSQSSINVVLADRRARIIAERWLSEAQVARDSIELALPLSDLRFVPGDVIEVPSGSASELYRIDRIDEVGHRLIGAVRIEDEIFDAPIYHADGGRSKTVEAIGAVHATFLDLPLLTGQEVPQAPYVAVFGRRSGAVAIYSSGNDSGYRLNTQVSRNAIFGETLTPLLRAEPGRWMPATLDIRLRSGALQSRGALDVFDGANCAALSFGGDGNWEVFQFQSAELISPMIYRIGPLLRGQVGTDAIVPAEWPIGSDFILIDAAVTQIDMPMSARGIERHYRVGPSAKSFSDQSYSHQVFRSAATGLRPYRPCHFTSTFLESGGVLFKWIRRTRLDGDNWQGLDVPVGQERERYLFKVQDRDGSVLVSDEVGESQMYWTGGREILSRYGGYLVVDVAQISEHYGVGPSERILLNE